MLHALHSACLSHVWLRHRRLSKNNRNVLKISYIKGKYLGNRYLPLVFCAYSACSKCRIRGQNQERVSQKSGACFPKIRSVFPKPFICFAKQGRSSLPNSLPSASSLTTLDNPSKTWLLLSLFVPLTFVTSTVLFFFYDKRVAFVTFLYHLSSFYTEKKSHRLIDAKPKGYNICCYAILNL